MRASRSKPFSLSVGAPEKETAGNFRRRRFCGCRLNLTRFATFAEDTGCDGWGGINQCMSQSMNQPIKGGERREGGKGGWGEGVREARKGSDYGVREWRGGGRGAESTHSTHRYRIRRHQPPPLPPSPPLTSPNYTKLTLRFEKPGHTVSFGVPKSWKILFNVN